jgi:hypothetical protein
MGKARRSIEPTQPNRLVRRQRQHNEAFAPVTLFAARRIADDADSGGVTLIEREPWQSTDDGLQLVMIRRAIGRERNHRAQSGESRG